MSFSASVAVFWDDDLRIAAQRAGANYWACYIFEMCQQLGLMADRLTRRRLRRGELQAYRVLLLPDLPPQYLLPEEKEILAQWTQAGGLLIGFATGGLGPLFGIVVEDEIPQPDDPFTPVATLRYMEPTLARSVIFPGEEDLPLLIVSPVKYLRPQGAVQELARLLSLSGRDLRRPAITWRRLGAGHAAYFAFNLPQTIWTLHHGRPILDDYDGDGMLRMSDAMITRPFPTCLPYADLLLYLLRNLIARQGLPFLHALPPTPAGEIPDCLFYYGGDDEGQPENQLLASQVMKELGLGYHVNLMPNAQGAFAVSREEYETVKANGHELSLHFNFVDGVTHPYRFSRAEIQRQVEAYVDAFGELPVCTVFHYTTWHGWTEIAAWLAAAGVKADNSRFIHYSPPANPVNKVGFGFGTALPFFHYHDWRSENERIPLLALPIAGYEAGYQGEEVDLPVLRRAIELARFWHLPLNLFYHPVYLARYPACREALRQGLAYIARLGLRVMHWGCDRMTHWWLARARARLEASTALPQDTCSPPPGQAARPPETETSSPAASEAEPARPLVGEDESSSGVASSSVPMNAIPRRWRVSCDWEDGCIVQCLWPHGTPDVRVDDQPAVYCLREEYGGRWLYIAVPRGEHLVQIT